MSSHEGHKPDPGVASAILTLANTDTSDALEFGQFASAMSSLASTVCVATAAFGDERFGRTVTAVTSLAPQPPTLLVSITRDSDLARVITLSGRFSLSLLSEGQQEIGDAFAGKGNIADRFAIGHWDHWPSGQPKLEGAATSIECRVVGRIELDTRLLVVGMLVGSETSEARPLLWYGRDYETLASSQSR